MLCRKCADRHDQGLGAVIASIKLKPSMICNLDKLKPTSPSWAIGSKDELLSSVKLWLLLLNRNLNNEVRLLDLRLAVLAAFSPQ